MIKSSCLAAVLFAVSALHAQPTWSLIGPAFASSPAELHAAAAAVPAEPFAEVTVLLEHERYSIAADGKVTHVHDMLYRIETKAAIEDWDQTSVEWDPWFQTQPSIRARVIQPDGRITELDAKTLTDTPAKNEGDGTLSDARIHKGPLPALAVGAIVEEETVVTDKLPFFSGGNVYRIYFSRNVPVVRSRLIVETPADLPVVSKIHELPESIAHTEQEGAVRRTIYDVAYIPESVDSDIDLATDKERSAMVEFSTGASWHAVAVAYGKMAEGQIQPEQVKSLLPAASQERMASIKAIVAKLHREVRYTGIEFGESALKPQTPAEILKRHYGDCKDKAALLVAMLRAAGVPANLALLDVGPGLDVNPDLPGMSQFDHAITFVPAAPGQPELWIDATAEFTQVGELPYGDEGRLALVIAEGTTGLTRTPDAKPTDSVLVETREVTLAQVGPAHIVESSATTGHIDSDYRSRYGGPETKATREDLDSYSKRVYLAKSLTKIEHGDGGDLAKPFSLRLVMEKASRGNTSLVDAVVAIPPAGVLGRLPSWFSTEPPDEARLTPEQQADRHKAEQQRSSDYLLHPFVTEWHYRIVIPDGFTAHALPEDQTVQMGPAIFTRHFVAESPSLVTAVYRFDTVRQRYTLEEALALRKAVLEADRQNFTFVLFDQVGAKLFADGKIRQAIAADRALIAAHPAQATHHIQMSAVLLDAGLGEQAQAEARLATTLDPGSSIAFYQFAHTLEHNSIGVQYARGFDRKGAIQAYLTARKLDPDDVSVRTGLALLYEHNPEGERYTEGSNLADAVREYRELKAIDKDTYERYEDNMLYAMLYDREYAPLLIELAALPTNPTRDAFAITATAASQSVAAGLARAEHLSADTRAKATALNLAGLQLVRLNLYPQAAELLSAGLQGQQDAAQTARQVDMFRTLKHGDPPAFAATDPRLPVQRMFNAVLSGTLEKDLPLFVTRHAYADDAEWRRNLEHNDAAGILLVIAKQAQLPSSVMRDIIMNNLKFTVTGDDATGYRITLQSLGSAPQNLFVSRDEGQFRIVADGTDSAEVGNYALYLLRSKREAEARSLLDWKRDLVHRGGGDDPLSGDLFARFWTVGATSTPESIQIAALALTLQKPFSQTPLDAALAAYAKTPDDVDLTLLLASACANHRDAPQARLYLEKLLARYPDSITAITMMGSADNLAGDYASWKSLLAARLARHPTDRDLLSQSAYEAQAESDFARARKSFQQIIDSGKATASDYNALAWLGLFDDHVDASAIDAARQANQLTRNANFSELHTLACLYAAQGKTTEARQVLLQAMASANMAEPNSPSWFVFGSIYEQFGADEAAITAYRKVTKPEVTPINPTDTWVLAQSRLKALHAN